MVKKIIIFGGSGYLGFNLVKSLSTDSNLELTVVTRDSSKTSEFSIISNNINVIVGDVENLISSGFFKKNYYNVLVNLISLKQAVSEIDINSSCNINTILNYKLLNYFECEEFEHFIYFSTIQVYGSNLKGEISENNSADPDNLYALTHHFSEQLLQYFSKSKKFTTTVFRLSNSYGKPHFTGDSSWSLVINNFVITALKKNTIIINNNPDIEKDFIYISDVFDAVLQLIYKPTKRFEIFNLSTSKTYSLINVAEIIQKTLSDRYGITIKLAVNKNERESKESVCDKNFRISNEKLVNYIGQSFVKLESGIEFMIDDTIKMLKN